MIRSIDIRNFRCYRSLKIPECGRLNLIVGDNGSGKTALLEAIILALTTTTELGVRLRQQRGLEGSLGGTTRAIEQAMWGDYFYNMDMSEAISIVLSGDGMHDRSLEIARGGDGGAIFLRDMNKAEERQSPLVFTWRDHTGLLHSVTPIVGASGVMLPATGEDMEDSYFFSANQTISAVENAGRFSELSMQNRQKEFIRIITKEYSWISDIAVEVFAGSPVLYATIKDGKKKLPLPVISGGVNKAISFLLAMAIRPKAVLLIDEIENGIHFAHMEAIWRQVLLFMREYKCQIFASTHSRECLEALLRASGKRVDDILLFQAERSPKSHSLTPLSGEDLRLAVEYDEEVR